MQMINKNRNGVTLIALIATIIVLSIMLGVSIHYGLSGTKNIKNKKIESELSIVQEAIMQRYALVKSQKGLGMIATAITEDTTLENDTERPEGFPGTRLASSDAVADNGFETIETLVTYSAGANDKTYEEYYYLLDENDLSAIGITKRKTIALHRIYIVNYSTGEIFDVANHKYYITRTQSDTPIYTQPTINTTSEKNYDFNDD